MQSVLQRRSGPVAAGFQPHQRLTPDTKRRIASARYNLAKALPHFLGGRSSKSGILTASATAANLAVSQPPVPLFLFAFLCLCGSLMTGQQRDIPQRARNHIIRVSFQRIASILALILVKPSFSSQMRFQINPAYSTRLPNFTSGSSAPE